MRLLFLILLGICCLAACIVEGVGNEVPERNVCVSLTTQRLPVKKIRTYVIREGFMKAVIFITKRGLKVCADPHANWVKDAINHVDRRSNAKRNTVQTNPTGTQKSINATVTLSGN
uniref:Lymphotactin n=1 Tax=Jaculus jaculus TaxID=51337 RepID=A0A8C5NZ67_JACJA|nr:lymphotactin-like [Jaculus jaculus]